MTVTYNEFLLYDICETTVYVKNKTKYFKYLSENNLK